MVKRAVFGYCGLHLDNKFKAATDHPFVIILHENVIIHEKLLDFDWLSGVQFY
jgi:hypothetical protein